MNVNQYNLLSHCDFLGALPSRALAVSNLYELKAGGKGFAALIKFKAPESHSRVPLDHIEGLTSMDNGCQYSVATDGK